VVVDVRFPAVFLVEVLVGDVDVIDLGMVVLVPVCGKEMDPVLASMQVVSNVIVLVTMLQSSVCMVALRPGHPFTSASRSRATRRRALPGYLSRPCGWP
jgi:hypothetical protein